MRNDITERKMGEETFQVLYQASLQIQEPLGLKERLDRFLQTGREVLHLDRLNILLADPKGQWLQAGAGPETKDALEGIRVPVGPGRGGGGRGGSRWGRALRGPGPPLPSWQGASWLQTEGTAVGWVLDQKSPRVVRDLATEQTFSDEGFIAREGVRATLMLPLLVGGEAVGVFFLDSRTPGAYAERDLELLGPLAEKLALALQNARLVQELQARA